MFADRFSIEAEAEPAAANEMAPAPAAHSAGDLPDPEQEERPGQPEPDGEPTGDPDSRQPHPKKGARKKKPHPLRSPLLRPLRMQQESGKAARASEEFMKDFCLYASPPKC